MAQWGQQQQGWGQQAQGQQGAAGWGQQAAAQQPYGSQKDVTLVVTGCTHGTVGGIVRGSYQLTGENHGKPTYKKDGQVNGLDVMTYFWDDRDGPGFCGWWFGPKVGGDQVWAYHAEKTATMPPQTGWKVPYDGPVDQTFVISYKPKGAAGGAQQQPAQQQWAQQAQQQQQQGWGQQQQHQQQQQQMQQQRQQQQQSSAQSQQQKQQQMMEQQAKLAANRKQIEEAKAKQIEQQKVKMEQMKAHQQELIKHRAEEQAKKEQELAAKRVEQQAVINVRRALQQYKASMPNKVEENKEVLDKALAVELEKCGTQKERLAQEVEQAVTATKERIEQIQETLKKEEEKRQAEVERRKELRVKAVALVAELEILVDKSEVAAKGVGEEAEPLTDDSRDLGISEINACDSAVQEAAAEANKVAQIASEFVLKESADIKNTPDIKDEAPATCTSDLLKLVGRLNDAKRGIAVLISKCGVSKAKGIKKAFAKEKSNKSMASFKKFDVDKDGKLSRREIQAFSKGEYGFTLPVETLENICRILIAEGSKGVEKSCFHRVKVMIGVAREEAIDSKRKEAREAKEKKIADLKEDMTEKIKKASELITGAIEAVAKAEKQVEPLSASAKGLKAAEMVASADESDAVIEEAKTSVTTAKDAIVALNVETEAELKFFLASETKKLENTMKPLEAKNTKSAAISTKFRQDATKKNMTELEKLRKDGLAMIFHHQGAKKLMSADVFQEFDKKNSGKVAESAFVKFFKTCEKKEVDGEKVEGLSEDDASRLFAYLDADEQGFLPKEAFLNLIRKFMKIVKASVLTEDISIKSKPVRRLVEGEVLQALSGPTKEEDDAEISRIKVKAMSDDLEGWVTPVGNQGTIFMEDGGNVFKVVKDTILTGTFVIGGESKQKDRKLKVGETCEVREWARKEETTNLMRMKVRVQSDGQIGYVTSVGNTGITFMQVI